VKATNTIVFLGENTLGSHRVLPLLNEITWSRTWETKIEREAAVEKRKTFKQRLISISKAKGMTSEGFYGDIATRPFWTRIWIVQEVVLSRNPIIMFDDHEVLWDNFANSSWILDTIVQDVFPEIGTDPQGLANLKSIHNIREIYKFKNSNYRFVIYWSAFEGRNRQIRETWSMVYLAYSKCLS